MQVWTNKKNNLMYVITGYRINATNAQDGQIMVEYEKVEKDGTINKFVHEECEFLEKFEFCYAVNL